MGEDRACVPLDGVRPTTSVEETDPKRVDEGASAKGFVAVIESGRSLQDFLRSMQSTFSLTVVSYSTVSELEGQLQKAWPSLVILCLMQDDQASVSALEPLLELVPTVPVVVLGSVDDVDLPRTVLRLGAKGYIPVTKGFEIAIEAMRFILAGRGLSAGSIPGS